MQHRIEFTLNGLRRMVLIDEITPMTRIWQRMPDMEFPAAVAVWDALSLIHGVQLLTARPDSDSR
jgi:hypothetical protein